VSEFIVSAVFLMMAIAIVWALPLALALLTVSFTPRLPREERRRRRWTAVWVTVALAGVTGGLYPLFPAGIGLGMLLWSGYWLVRLPLAMVKSFRVRRADARTLDRLDKEFGNV
jgi:hypothetical protein